MVADQLSRPVRVIQGCEDGKCLGKSKEEIKGMQRAEARWQEMAVFLEGGRIPRSKYPRAYYTYVNRKPTALSCIY